MTDEAAEPRPRAGSLLQAQDFAWALFIAVLILTTPETNYNEPIVLVLIGAFQILEPRMRIFRSPRGQIVSVVLKMVLAYLLVGWTHGIESYYYAIFLIPVVSAATTFELAGVLVVTGVAIAAYFSFLPLAFVYYEDFILTPDALRLICLRASSRHCGVSGLSASARQAGGNAADARSRATRLAESNEELRKTQASLRRSERVAALGQLTAGLAHELRNPLGTIKASAEMLMKPAVKASPEVLSEMADYILSETDRMNGLVSNFLDFARPLEIHPAKSDLRAVLEDVARQLAEQAAQQGVELVVKCDEAQFMFEFDADLMRMTLGNLVRNSIQASPAGGLVEQRAARREDEVMIFVTDQGEGIQPQHLENIFNPFFTTKPQGVGLGLAIVSKIVDEHHGHINVFSEPGKGTTFEIILPATQGSA